jgi:hypothetical protein
MAEEKNTCDKKATLVTRVEWACHEQDTGIG